MSSGDPMVSGLFLRFEQPDHADQGFFRFSEKVRFPIAQTLTTN